MPRTNTTPAKSKSELSPFHQVYALVTQIPRGRVLTYGAISIMINRRLSAAAVGWAMRGLPEDESKTKNGSPYHSKCVPWHRVINSRGGISTNNEPGIPSGLQQGLLEAEGVKFKADGTIDLDKYLWDGNLSAPDGPAKAAKRSKSKRSGG